MVFHGHTLVLLFSFWTLYGLDFKCESYYEWNAADDSDVAMGACNPILTLALTVGAAVLPGE